MPRLLPNRDAFDEAARSALSGSDAAAHGALLVLEIDDFTALADTRGSRYAEGIAATIVRLTGAVLRGPDLVLAQPEGRVLALTLASTIEEARAIGERVCAAVRLHVFPESDKGPSHRVTASIGVAGIPEHGLTVAAVYAAADQACARIAEHGKDGAGAAPLAHHQALHRPLSIDRLAGRTEEFALLLRNLDEAAAGRPRVVAVLGESGLGTAMLLRRLEPEVRLRGGSLVCAASSRFDPVEPYAVWAGALRAISRLPDPPKREWREIQNLVPSLGDPLLNGAAGSQYRLLDELSDFVRAAAATRLLVVVLDEMQWADVTSWEALEHLMSQFEADRLMICLAARSEREFSEATDRRQVLRRHQVYQEIQLSRLMRDEVKQWLEAAFHQQEIGREFLAFLYRQTEGNPFFVSQLLHALLEEGALWYSGERWEWSPVSELRVPAGLPALLTRRLSRFSSSTHAVLGTAAIIGRTVDVDLVVASGAGSEPAVRLALSEAQSAGLVRQSYERDGGGFDFTHGEIGAALAESIPRDHIRQVHERVAVAVAARGRSAAESALHYDLAGSQSAAYAAAQAAAAAAESLYANASAHSYLQVAVRNAASPAQLADVRTHLAQLAETGGRYDEVEELCDLAVEWFEGQQDTRRAIGLRRMRERARLEQGQSARVTLDALLTLDEEAKAHGFDRERVAILTIASQTHGRLGDRRMAERIASECVEMAEGLGDRSLLADALLRLGSVLLSEVPLKADAILRRALLLYEGLGDVRGQARCYNCMGVGAQFESRLDEARHAYGLAISVARSAGMLDLWGAAALNLGVLMQKQGEYDRARELFGEALASFAAVKNSEYQLIALLNMAQCEHELGEWTAAGELYAATLPLAERIGQSDVEIGALAGAGLCFLETGQLDRGRALAEDVDQRMRKREDWFQNRQYVEALAVRIAVLDGRVDAAFDRFEAAIATAEVADVYTAAWLTAVCARTLEGLAPSRIKASVDRYSTTVQKLGYAEMTRRYKVLAGK